MKRALGNISPREPRVAINILAFDNASPYAKDHDRNG